MLSVLLHTYMYACTIVGIVLVCTRTSSEVLVFTTIIVYFTPSDELVSFVLLSLFYYFSDCCVL